MSSSDSSFSAPEVISLLLRARAKRLSSRGLTLLLGLLLGLLRRRGTASGSTTSRTRSGSGTAAGTDVGEQVLYVFALECLVASPSAKVLSFTTAHHLSFPRPPSETRLLGGIFVPSQTRMPRWARFRGWRP